MLMSSNSMYPALHPAGQEVWWGLTDPERVLAPGEARSSMPRWATWLPLLCTAATACSALASRPQDAPQHKGHARSLLHGVHAADAPEEYLDHLAADGKDPSTYLIELLQGNATATDSISSEQLTSLLWFLKGHLYAPQPLHTLPELSPGSKPPVARARRCWRRCLQCLLVRFFAV